MKTVITNPNGDDYDTERTVIILRACPFCGSSAVYVSYGNTEHGNCFYIGCASCGAKGPIVHDHLKITMDDAIDAWNDRRVVE